MQDAKPPHDAKPPLDAKPPFSRLQRVDDVPETGLDLKLVASEAERARLAAIDGLEALSQLEADLHVDRRGKAGLRVTGEVRARLTQICVVSLEPFETQTRETIDVVFAPQAESEAAHARAAAEIAAALDKASALAEQPDPPDPIIDGRVDLGALCAEFFALSLDPYPRKPGAAFVEPAPAQPGDAPASPFEMLQKLKK